MVIVSLSDTNLASSGKIRLSVDVHAPPGAEVIIPEIEPLIEPFRVAGGYAEPVQTLPNGKQLHRRTWILLPDLPGSTLFQPLVITAGSTAIQTEPVTVSVTSVLPEGLEELEIRDLAGPAVLLPGDRERRKLWLLLAAALAGAGGAFLMARRIRRREDALPPAPHEMALEALQTLPDPPPERIHELNRILRVYLEARFDLPAVGKTSQEILGYDTPALDADIARFLEAGEAFRFSHRVPEGFAGEAEEGIRRFIEQTREMPCS
jgi:hypothetical protein